MCDGTEIKIINRSLMFGVSFFLLFAYPACSEKDKPVIDGEKRVNLANTYYNSELYQAAINEYQEYLDLYTPDPNRQANITYQIANIYFERLHNYEKALEYYLRVKHLYPESNLQGEVGKQIVNCLERLERSQDAQRMLEKETALKPETVETHRPGEIVATIGTNEITQGDLDFEIGQLPPYLREQFSTKEKKRDFLRQYIAERLLYDSAKRKNLDKDKEVIEGTFRAKRSLMAQKVLQEEIQKMVDIKPADVELYYRANKDRYAEKDEQGNISRQVPYEQCAQQVAQDLLQERQQEAYNQLLERLMKAEDVKIFEQKIK
jgi:tetratricopeptide (TPR) repeat protein